MKVTPTGAKREIPHCQPRCVAKFRRPPSLHLRGELGYSWAGEKSSVLVIREEQTGKLHLCQALLKNLSLSQASWMFSLLLWQSSKPFQSSGYKLGLRQRERNRNTVRRVVCQQQQNNR